MHPQGWVIALLLALLPGWASAITTGDPQLDPLFEQLIDGKRDERVAALQGLANTDRDDKGFLLRAILEGDIMVLKKESRVVRVVKDGRQARYYDLLSGDELGLERTRRFSRISIDNRLRITLRSVIASLGLRSDDPAQRLAAVNALIDDPAGIDAKSLSELIEAETNGEVQSALSTLQALSGLESDDAAIRSGALQALAGNLSPDVRRAITAMANGDADKNVQALALEIQAKQAGQLRLYGHMETVFFGLSLGSVLVLAAIGLAITFGVMGVINMAHGELIMLGAYTTWALQQLMPQSLGLALLLSVPAAFVVSGIVGIIIERSVIRHLYGRPLETLLSTFGISLILQQAVRTFISSQNVPVANPEFMSGVITFNSAFSLTLNRVYILGFCLLVFLTLLVLLKRTRLGLEVRAVSQNRSMARALGIRSARVDAMTFGLGAGIAGIAGVALSQLTNVGPNLGQAYIVDSFMVVVFGGVGNLWGTLVGGMTLGVANKLMEPWAGAILAKILVLVFLIAFIQKRPRGLFPQRGRAAEA